MLKRLPLCALEPRFMQVSSSSPGQWRSKAKLSRLSRFQRDSFHVQSLRWRIGDNFLSLPYILRTSSRLDGFVTEAFRVAPFSHLIPHSAIWKPRDQKMLRQMLHTTPMQLGGRAPV
jgi:hypothetical protein